MAIIAADRAANTSTTTGTGTFTLDGSKAGYQTLLSGCGSGSTIYYSALNVTTGEWEVGSGLLTAGTPNTLTRATVIDGSNGPGVHVAFSGGGLDVFSTAPASKLPLLDPVTGLLDISGGMSLTVPLAVTSGGNGLNTAALGDLRYGSGANTLAVLAGNTTSVNKFLRSTGTGSAAQAPAWTTLVAGDIPNLDAAKITTGTLPVALGGNGLNTAALGDLRYGSGANTLAALAGNITTTKKFLTQTGTGTVSAAPGWGQVLAADVQAGTFSGAFAFANALSVTGTITGTTFSAGSGITVSAGGITVNAGTSSFGDIVTFLSDAAHKSDNAGSILYTTAGAIVGGMFTDLRWARHSASDFSIGAIATLRLYGSNSVTPTITITAGTATFTGNVLAATDNTYDIGASGASRFRNLNLAGNATVSGTTTLNNTTSIHATLEIGGGTPAGGEIHLYDRTGATGHDWLIFANDDYNIYSPTFGIALAIKFATGIATFGAPVVFPGYTVATLPAGAVGQRAYVTDATAPTFLGTLTGGGSVKTPVFHNGTAWVAA